MKIGIIGFGHLGKALVNGLIYKNISKKSDIYIFTAFAACGLGFASYILSAFQNTGETLGFSKEISEKIVRQTFMNAINMGDFAQTAKAVATQGGATEQGIICFEENELQHTIEEAVQRAYKKMI